MWGLKTGRPIFLQVPIFFPYSLHEYMVSNKTRKTNTLGRKGSYQNLILLFYEPESVCVHVFEEKAVITGMITQTQDCTVLLQTSRVSSALGQIVLPAITSSIHTLTLWTHPTLFLQHPHQLTRELTTSQTQPTHHTSAKIKIKVCLIPIHHCKWNLQETALPRSHLYNSSFPGFSGLMFHNSEIAIWTI